MTFSTTIQQVEKPVSTTPSNTLPDALLTMLILSMYGAQVSKKTLRKLKRQFLWTSLKLKVKSIFKPRTSVSDRTLIYILVGVAIVALIFLSPYAALVLALLAIILILAGVI
jgi:hypothetical protein